LKSKTLLYQWIFGVVASLFIIITTYVYYAKGHINNGDIEFEKIGTYGDFIGGLLGTILSIVAVILIYKTFISQKEELQLNRELFSSQQFENTFFNMLNVHQELRKEISFDIGKNGIFGYSEIVPNGIIKGKSFFEFAQNDFTNLWKYEYDDKKINNISDKIGQRHKEYDYKYETHSSIKVSDSKGNFINKSVDEHLKDIIELKYPIFWKNYANYIGDYFRNIYHILKYISDEKLKEINLINNKLERETVNEKYKKYADILQSQMTYSELFFMFYNALTYTKVKKYINEFNFIENLLADNLLHPKHANFEGMGNIKTT